jgi:hypothetical protein
MVTLSLAAGYWLRVIHWLPGTGCRAPAVRVRAVPLAAVRLRIEATG